MPFGGEHIAQRYQPERRGGELGLYGESNGQPVVYRCDRADPAVGAEVHGTVHPGYPPAQGRHTHEAWLPTPQTARCLGGGEQGCHVRRLGRHAGKVAHRPALPQHAIELAWPQGTDGWPALIQDRRRYPLGFVKGSEHAIERGAVTCVIHRLDSP
jgi:hypothetical protein